MRINNTPELTKLNKMLCRVAGADESVLSQCPHEIPRHARIGAIVLSTAFLASVSMFFAIYMVSSSVSIGFVAALIWGVAIYLLDSFIVASYRKNDDWKKEFRMVFPRLILAIVIGSSIATPLELKVFETDIAIAIKELDTEKELQQLDMMRSEHNKAIQPNKVKKEALQKDNANLNATLKQYEDRVKELENDLNDEIAARGRTKKNGDGPVAKSIREQMIKARNEKETKEKAVLPRIAENNIRISQLDAAIINTSIKSVEKHDRNGILARLDGLKKLKKENVDVAIAYWLFCLLILGIETAPLFVKFFTPKGSYDEILAMNEYMIFIGEQKRKSDAHELINSEIEALRSINKKRGNAQDMVNEQLMTGIANAQGEIAEKAIAIWKSKQLGLVEENLDDFITSNNL